MSNFKIYIDDELVLNKNFKFKTDLIKTARQLGFKIDTVKFSHVMIVNNVIIYVEV
jgi:hypothetical protein